MRKFSGGMYVSAAVLTVALGLGGIWRVAAVSAQPVDTLPSRVNVTLGLSASTVASIALPKSAAVPFQTQVVIDGQVRTLDLSPVSVRAPNYQVLVQGADGLLVSVDPGPTRTLRGEIVGIPGSKVAGSLFDDGLHARVLLPDGGEFWIEPIASKLPGAKFDQHAVYRQADVLPPGKNCGNDAAALQVGGRRVQPKAPDSEKPFDPSVQGHSAPAVAELANDADVEYYQDHGSSVAQVVADIEAITNSMNIQYERDADITHTITTTIVRTAEPDPYTATDHDGIINEFRDEWNNNQGSVQRDVAQLFTGKEVDGSVIGRAFDLGTVCNLSDAYCFVQSDFNANFACKTDLSAHELGHCWNAFHCSCGFPNSFTMNASITCANVFNPEDSIPTIVGWRSVEACVANGPAAPANDTCATATVLCPGTVGGTTDGAGNDAIASCLAAADVGAADAWYSYTPGTNGTATVDTCGTVFDTVLSAHSACPGGGANELECNDDTNCGGGARRQSEVSFSVTGGVTYLIRVSGWRKQAGDFSLTLAGPDCGCTSDPECDDGDACNGAETCVGGVCQNGTPPPCQNGDGCCPAGCTSANDDDCTSCGGQNAPCTSNDDCCSGLCRSNGKCSKP